MTATAAPQGLVPIFHPSGLVRSRAIVNGIDPAVTQNFFRGTPVQMTTDGFLIPLADVAWDAAADDFFGVFEGIEYNDSAGRRRLDNKWLGPSTLATDKGIVVYVWTDPDIIYNIQADGSLAQTSVLDQAMLVNPTLGSSVTGISSMALDASPLAGAGTQGYLRILGLDPQPGNDWADAFTIVQVQIATHQNIADKVAV